MDLVEERVGDAVVPALELIDAETDVPTVERIPPLMHRVFSVSQDVTGLCVTNYGVLLADFKKSKSKEAKAALREAMDK